MRKYVAEFIAVFFLVFAGAGAIIADGHLAQFRVTDSFGPLGIALAHGLALGVAIAAVIHISGGHVNPAITIAFWVARRMSASDAAGYVAAQLLGGASAAFLLKVLTPPESFDFAGGGVTALNDIEVYQGAAIEVILTFFLAFVIWGVAVDRRAMRSLAPFAIGLTVTFGNLVGGSFTGAAMNPARWFGPALAGGGYDNWPVWTAGPILGALLASLLYETFFLSEPEEDLGMMTPEDEEEEPSLEVARAPLRTPEVEPEVPARREAPRPEPPPPPPPPPPPAREAPPAQPTVPPEPQRPTSPPPAAPEPQTRPEPGSYGDRPAPGEDREDDSTGDDRTS